MSRNKKKKTPNISNNNKSYENPPEKRQTRRRINWIRILSLLAALAILITAFGIGISLFGSTTANSYDYNSSKVPTVTAAPAADSTTTAAASTTSQTTTTSKNAESSSAKHYIQPADAEWNLKLVNAWNALDKEYPIQLTTISGNYQYDSRAAKQLEALLKAGHDYNVRPCSFYRSIETQTRLFNNEVKTVKKAGQSQEDAENVAANAVARPWQSEHNLGLAADFLFENYSDLKESYENTNAYKWMIAHCADYGFILRYPKDKVDVTGVMFEPWHYRYVGEEAAHEIMSRGITLEEYLQEKGK